MRTPEELALSKEYINLIIADHLCRPIAEVTSATILNQANEAPVVFCLTLVNIAHDIGMEFDIDIEPDVYENWVTAGDVEKHIDTVLEER
jgi:hypothetical protein